MDSVDDAESRFTRDGESATLAGMFDGLLGGYSPQR